MNYLEQVQSGIDYIEANLDQDVEVPEVARQAGLSQWHFQRIFKALTNETLKTYIRSRRLANSLTKLAETDQRIIEIAIEAGFESQESFTRAFKVAFEVTPADYRRRQKSFQFLRKIRFDREYLRHIHQSLSLVPEMIWQPAMQLVGMRTRYYGSDSEKNNMANKLPALWGSFLSCWKEIPHQVGGTGYGVILPTADSSDELDYWAAVEVTQIETIASALESLSLPPQRYAKFTHRGLVSQLDQTVNYIYSSWLLNSGMRHTGGADLEIYGAEYQPDSEESVVYYSIPVEERIQ